MKTQQQLQQRIRGWMTGFIVCLVLSGVTAFPLRAELGWLCGWWPEHDSGFYHWLVNCSVAIARTDDNYPFLAYGDDWLAFSHIVIALFFLGVIADPVKNKWVLNAGATACGLVIPLAFIAGQVRQIPVWWRLIDCSFGLIGIIPLFICLRATQQLENILLHHTNKNNEPVLL